MNIKHKLARLTALLGVVVGGVASLGAPITISSLTASTILQRGDYTYKNFKVSANDNPNALIDILPSGTGLVYSAPTGTPLIQTGSKISSMIQLEYELFVTGAARVDWTDLSFQPTVAFGGQVFCSKTVTPEDTDAFVLSGQWDGPGWEGHNVPDSNYTMSYLPAASTHLSIRESFAVTKRMGSPNSAASILRAYSNYHAPEPASLSLLAMGLAVTMQRKRRA